MSVSNLKPLRGVPASCSAINFRAFVDVFADGTAPGTDPEAGHPPHQIGYFNFIQHFRGPFNNGDV